MRCGTLPAVAEMLAGRYRLVDRIGTGGDEFWRAEDTVDPRTVGVRLLRSWPDEDTWYAERFLRNIEGLARNRVDGFVPILDFGVDSSVGVYLAVEFVDDESLATRLERLGPLEPGPTMRLVARAADALDAAHTLGVVHHGVRPRKMFPRPDGGLVLTDLWGGGFTVRLDAANVTVERARYVSPEEAKGEQAGTGADIYALGVVAHTCLAGRPPFDHENPLALALMQVRDLPPPLPDAVPAAVRALVAAALAKNEGDRPDAARLAAWARSIVDASESDGLTQQQDGAAPGMELRVEDQ
jgi:serine/threonine-protein kinase